MVAGATLRSITAKTIGRVSLLPAHTGPGDPGQA